MGDRGAVGSAGSHTTCNEHIQEHEGRALVVGTVHITFSCLKSNDKV
jgi:hypothetical protein